jgi:hypothetical protein
LEAADFESATAEKPPFSSIKVSAMKLLMMAGLICEKDLDQTTTPEVVRISKESNILALYGAHWL